MNHTQITRAKSISATVAYLRKKWKSKSGVSLSIKNNAKNIDDAIKIAIKCAHKPSVLRALNYNGLKRTDREQIRSDVAHYLFTQIKNLLLMEKLSVYIYDEWAYETANQIRSIYHDSYVSDYTYGNAQKLINMSLKYFLSSNFANIHNDVWLVCHFPVDSIIQKEFKKESVCSPLSVPWSKNDDWNEFLTYQNQIRKYCRLNSFYSPLILEINVW